MQLSILLVMWRLIALVLLRLLPQRYIMLNTLQVFLSPPAPQQCLRDDWCWYFWPRILSHLRCCRVQPSVLVLRIHFCVLFGLDFADEHVYFEICISVCRIVVRTDAVTVEFTSLLAHHCSGMYVRAQNVSCLSHSDSISNSHRCLVVCLFFFECKDVLFYFIF